jgi:hypothetical protein
MFRIPPRIGRLSPLFHLGRIGISPGMFHVNPLFIGMSSYRGTGAKGRKCRRKQNQHVNC